MAARCRALKYLTALKCLKCYDWGQAHFPAGSTTSFGRNTVNGTSRGDIHTEGTTVNIVCPGGCAFCGFKNGEFNVMGPYCSSSNDACLSGMDFQDASCSCVVSLTSGAPRGRWPRWRCLTSPSLVQVSTPSPTLVPTQVRGSTEAENLSSAFLAGRSMVRVVVPSISHHDDYLYQAWIGQMNL
jgi:hypothetical protein